MNFKDFFQAAWDKEPFPWQVDLAELAMRGDWPPSIGLPTAAGKTALIDIAVFALGMRASGAARRIFFVVDRRVIVDEAAARAQTLANKLCSATADSALWPIARNLRALAGDQAPLVTGVLRGGIPRDDSWAESPLQPAVICSTVDQVGSSLLFRSYGTSDYGRPIRAGLAASDSLIILDEAHTSQPFAQTLERLRQYFGWAERPVNAPLKVIEMSATPRSGESFTEHEDDLNHPVLKARWNAEKRARLVLVESGKAEVSEETAVQELIARLAVEARAMRDSHGARVIGVIANRVLVARKVHEILQADPEADAILMTGRARPFDRDELWNRWKQRIGLDRSSPPERPVFVVATQCIEVGANIDFDALVTEIASIDALEQRFGRLDRNGQKSLTQAAIVAHKQSLGATKEDAIYGGAINATWKWLKDHTITEFRTEILPAVGKKKPRTIKTKNEFVHMGVLALRRDLRNTEDRAALLLPRRAAAVLMPAHMDLLCQTSPEPAISPEPSVFLHGPHTDPADCQVIWRADLNEEATDSWLSSVAICPPSAAEAISLPVWTVRAWLTSQKSSDISDLEGAAENSERRRYTDSFRPVLWWKGSDDGEILSRADGIRPGFTLVVPSSYGGCDDWGWNPEWEGDVDDIGDQVKLLMGRPLLRLHPRLTQHWPDAGLAESLRQAESEAEAREILSEIAAQNSESWVLRAAEALSANRRLRLVEQSEDEDSWVALVGRGVFDQNSVRGSFTKEIALAEHLRGCERMAARFASELPEPLKTTVVRAAALHDIGKADPRFQAWLRGGNPSKPRELIAKSSKSGSDRNAIERARRMAGYPNGGRHELTSTALLRSHPEDFPDTDYELLLHLIASHHGRCRPFAPIVDDPESITVSYQTWQASTDHRLEAVGSGICERFWRLTRRYGWYGLAYLETLLRLADQRQSEAEEESAATQAKGMAHA